MNSAEIHLILNHIPVIGIGFGISLMIYGFIRNSGEVKRTALGLFVLAALVIIPVYLTGEPAEEIVEDLAGVSEAIIEQHEAMAIYALILVEITGVLALLNLVFFSRSFGKKFLAVTSLSSVVAAVVILWTANLGGEIRHTEIRGNSAQTINSEKRKETEHEEKGEDDH